VFSSYSPTVNEHLPRVTDLLKIHGEEGESRNGPVIFLPEPLEITTTKPWIRTALVPARKSNPFVDFFDGLFILAGTRDYNYLTEINPRFEQYTEYDGKAHGQYSHRILNHFGFNQLLQAAEILVADPHSRRAVIQMWDPRIDQRSYLQDVPCNLCVLPSIRNGFLDLTVFNRSNDIYWGMLGVNIVQFSFLQEVLAYLVDCPIGTLRQISNNAHAYIEFGPYSRLAEHDMEPEAYSEDLWVPLIVPQFHDSFSERVRTLNDWMRQLTGGFVAGFQSLRESNSVFLREVVYPMSIAHRNKDVPGWILDANWRKAVEIYYAG
jgi:Thymidylate synthase